MGTADTVTGYLQQYGPAIAATAQKYQLDPVRLASQIALETGWGQHVIPGSNNPGNIKQFGGGGVAATDNQLGTSSNYQQFPTLAAGIDAMGSLLARKYASGGNLKGYAEDPNYDSKLGGVTNTMRKYAGDVLGFMTGSTSANAGELTPAQRAYGNATNGPTPPPSAPKPATASGASVTQGQQDSGDPFADLNAKFSPTPASGNKSSNADPFAELNAQFAPQAQAAPAAPAAAAAPQDGASAPGAPAPMQPAAQNAPGPQAGASPAPAAVTPAAPPAQKGFWARSLDAVSDPSQWAHQIGLTARQGLEGAASLGGLVVDPVTGTANALLGTHIPTTQASMSQALDAAGLPKEQNATERVVGDINRAMSSAAAGGGVAKTLAGAASPYLAGVADTFGANMGTQIASAAGGAGAAGATREAGGSGTAQLGASLLGALAGGGLAKGADMTTNAIANMLESRAPGTASGLDWLTGPRPATGGPTPTRLGETTGAIDEMSPGAARVFGAPPDERQAARMARFAAENPDATPEVIRRAADFESLGMTPTAGQVGRGPEQFSREQNLRLQQPELANRFNQQDNQLRQILGGFEDSPPLDRYQAGQNLVDSFASMDREAGQRVTSAYNTARASADARLDVPTTGLAQDYGRIVDDFGDAIPAAVQKRFNRYGFGDVSNQRAVFDMNDANELTKLINKHVGNDATTNTALGELRRAVNDAVQSAPDGGGLFTEAKQLAQARFAAREAMPILDDAAARTANADTAFRRYILGGQTPQVEAMGEALRTSAPDTYSQMRAQIQAHLEDAAYGSGEQFNPGGYRKALEGLGPRKLAAFFTPEEINDMRTVGRVGYAMRTPPSGHSVNFSNSATALLGEGLLARMADKVPVVGAPAVAAAKWYGNRRFVNQALEGALPQAQGLPAALGGPQGAGLPTSGLLGLLGASRAGM